MEPFSENLQCPSCFETSCVEHIELDPVDERVRGCDRRFAEDLAYLSLIINDRRTTNSSRRGIDTRNLLVEREAFPQMVCLNCGYLGFKTNSNSLSSLHTVN